MSGWRTSTNPLAFEQAATWFLRRLPLPATDFYDLATRWRREAFTITGIAQVRVIEDVVGMIDRAMRDGVGFRAFQKEALPKLQAAWDGSVKNPGHRVETIYRNAAQTAYNDGRREQMTIPTVLRTRPFWMYDAVLDEATTELCKSLNQTVLPNTDPWWDSHWPPLHHRCRSAVRTLSRSAAERRGIAVVPPTEEAQDGFGRARAPLADGNVDLAGAPASVRQAYERRQQQAPTEPSDRARRVAEQPGLFGSP